MVKPNNILFSLFCPFLQIIHTYKMAYLSMYRVLYVCMNVCRYISIFQHKILFRKTNKMGNKSKYHKNKVFFWGKYAPTLFLSATKYNFLFIHTYIHLLLYLCVYVSIYWRCRYVWIVRIMLKSKWGGLVRFGVFNDGKQRTFARTALPYPQFFGLQLFRGLEVSVCFRGLFRVLSVF